MNRRRAGIDFADFRVMRMSSYLKRALTALPPWVIIGAAGVMLPVVAIMAREHLNRQEAAGLRLLTEKGAALIRSFEAGARHGMMGMNRSGFRLQRLLMETAKQPDIVYLAVVEIDGTVAAHSDPNRIGTRFGFPSDMAPQGGDDRLAWRIREPAEGSRIFEVYSRFQPLSGMGRMGHRHRGMAGAPERQDPEPRTIFVGLDMGPIDAVRQSDIRHTMLMGAIILMIGFAGIVLLLMAQSFRATRENLSRVRAFSDSLVEHLPVGLLALGDTMTVAALNPAGAAILGLSETAVVGSPARDRIPGALVDLAETLVDGRPVLAREIDCPVPGRDTVPLEVSASRLYDEDGRFLGSLVLFVDLAEMVSLRREVTRSQRLAAIGRLAAGVAHEIRNPLSSIKGFATVFRERYQHVAEDQQTAAFMVQEVDRLNRVVTQLLDFARPVAVVRKPVQMRAIMDDIRQLIAERAEGTGVSVAVEVTPAQNPFQTDPDQVRQLLLNLCLNALDAMPEGGTLTLSSVPSDGGCRLRVSDTGVGIPEADLGRIFDPYFTTRHTGTGLGLAIVHNIVDALGGTIRVESRVGEGTTVTVTLPENGVDHDA